MYSRGCGLVLQDSATRCTVKEAKRACGTKEVHRVIVKFWRFEEERLKKNKELATEWRLKGLQGTLEESEAS